MATGRRRGRAFIYIALILILLLVLVFALTRMGSVGIPGLSQPVEGQTAEQQAAPTPTVKLDTVDIVVTTQQVRRGEELSERLLQVVAIPREDYAEGVFFNTVEDLTGARARYDLEAHTPVTNALIVQREGGSIPSFEIPKGMVAISIPISKLSSVSYGLQKGDHVNIIASILLVDLDTNWQTRLPNRTGVVVAPGPIIEEERTNITAELISPDEYTVTGGRALSYLGRIEIDPAMNNPVYILPSEPQRPRLVSQTLIQDVVILQIGYFPLEGEKTQPAADQVESTALPGEEAPPPAPVAPEVATLIVSPQDAVTLNYLMLTNASLNLVMRSAGDDQRIDTEAVTLQFILDQHRIPVPAKLPYSTEPRINNTPAQIYPFPEPGIAVPTPGF